MDSHSFVNIASSHVPRFARIHSSSRTLEGGDMVGYGLRK